MQNRKLLICDDFFPNLLTAFRVAEYNALMEHFPTAVVRSWAKGFTKNHAAYAAAHPAYAKRVGQCTEYSFPGAGFAYTNFLLNATQLLAFDAMRCPFAFTLYPGGGFGLHDPMSDAWLKYVLSSPLLRAIVVTTSVTESYVREKLDEWSVEKRPEISRIDGVVIPSDYFAGEVGERTYFGEEREALNVCFAANKYMPRLEHKGYPEFVHAAREVGEKFPFVRFHVVGGADETDGDYGAVNDRVTYYGGLETSKLRAFFHNMDLIVSPSLAGKVHVGQFDGFPTATCVEAALCGVGLIVSNPIGLEEKYSAAGAARLVDPTPESVTNGLMGVVAIAATTPGTLREFGERARSLSRELYGFEAQMRPRIELLERLMQSE